MSRSISIQLRLLIVLPLLFVMAGCMQSPEQKLIGRWYHAKMTFRFREDGAVVWNSTNGLGVGRYTFSGEVPSAANTSEVLPNLYVEVLRDSEIVKRHYELSFLGNDRVQLRAVSEDTSSANPNTVIMRRANDEIFSGKPIASATPEDS